MLEREQIEIFNRVIRITPIGNTAFELRLKKLREVDTKVTE